MFDDEFTTVPFLASEEVPPNWAELVSKSESVTTADYDLAEIWIRAHEDATKPVLNQEGESNSERDRTVSFEANANEDTIGTATTPPSAQSELFVRSPEGDQANETNRLVSEGGNKNLNILLQPTQQTRFA